MPRWFEIALPIPAALVDEAAALLDFAGFGGVEIRDKGERCDVIVVVETDDVDARAREAHDAIAVLDAGAPIATELDPKIWTENWKKHFARKTFADRIEVRPPWEEASPPSSGLLSIVINPGMAFGTGLHETTAGCLELLVEEVKPGFVVADVGCGSGILAIAAAKLGASNVLATDVDPLAVEATAENIASNGVARLVRVELEPGEIGIPEWENDARPGLTSDRDARRAADERATKDAAKSEISQDTRASTRRDASVDAATVGLASGERGRPNGASEGGFAACAAASFDLVVANILAETLIEMCETLTSAVKPGGTLLLSGIEARRLKSVEEAFIRSPWRRRRTITRGDWVSISLHHEVLAGPEQKAS